MDIKTLVYMAKCKLNNYYYKYFAIPKRYNKIHNIMSNLHIKSIEGTAKKLVNSNKSLSRFGDGEFKWILGVKHTHSFEKSSQKLSNKLLKVLFNNNDKLMIGLPDGFLSNPYFVTKADFFWKQFCSKYGNQILSLVNTNKQYYNTSVSRPYIDYNNRKIAIRTFRLWKKLWYNKNLLIVEGTGSRLGFHDKLFNNVKAIKRIECPPINAFESYSTILNLTLKFLCNSKKHYMVLLSLGPTATILAYDLCKRGFRAIDVGHIDIEYDWFILGTKEKINIPYKYVNEVPNGNNAVPIFNKKILKEVVCKINNKKAE